MSSVKKIAFSFVDPQASFATCKAYLRTGEIK